MIDRIKRKQDFSEQDIVYIIRQLLSAVAYCHSKNIVHRDLKLENLLLSSEGKGATLKIIDFGMSEIFDPRVKMSTRLGTPLYIAPEVLSKSYTEKCDIWSCGVILFILLSGSLPFKGTNQKELYHKIHRGIYSMSGGRWDGISKHAKNLVQSMMEINPLDRCSALEALDHPWIKDSYREKVNSNEAGSMLAKIKTFSTQYKLQQAALSYIISQLLSDQEKQKFHSLFLAIDKDNDGRLSRNELIEGYQRFCEGQSLSNEEANKIMEELDISGNGYIELTEFIMGVIETSKVISRPRVMATFRMFDKDDNGVITADEIEIVLGIGARVSDHYWKEMIKEADLDGDSVISFDEFSNMMFELVRI